MNERIRDLQIQALAECKTFEDGKFIRTDEVFERFAELIVRECAELIDNKERITAAQTYDEVFVAKFDTKELCAKQIREHFGVDDD